MDPVPVLYVTTVAFGAMMVPRKEPERLIVPLKEPKLRTTALR
jgi:hypothetical protein